MALVEWLWGESYPADFDKRTPFFGKRDFAYDAGRDVYVCPRGEDLRRYAREERLRG